MSKTPYIPNQIKITEYRGVDDPCRSKAEFFAEMTLRARAAEKMGLTVTANYYEELAGKMYQFMSTVDISQAFRAYAKLSSRN
jgi:hypothetical protein